MQHSYINSNEKYTAKNAARQINSCFTIDSQNVSSIISSSEVILSFFIYNLLAFFIAYQTYEKIVIHTKIIIIHGTVSELTTAP